jgi:hypothetical protein
MPVNDQEQTTNQNGQQPDPGREKDPKTVSRTEASRTNQRTSLRTSPTPDDKQDKDKKDDAEKKPLTPPPSGSESSSAWCRRCFADRRDRLVAPLAHLRVHRRRADRRTPQPDRLPRWPER